MPRGSKDEFSCKCSYSPEGMYGLVSLEDRYEEGLKFGPEGWAGREKSCAFPPKGLVISIYCYDCPPPLTPPTRPTVPLPPPHAGKQQPWVETSTLQELLELRQSEFFDYCLSWSGVMCSQ